MTDQAINTTATATDGSGKTLLIQVFYGVALTVSALLVFARFMDSGLPGCTSTRANNAIQSILRHNNLAGATVSGTREVSKETTEIRCAAVLSTSDGAKHDLTYRIFKRDSGRVTINANWRLQ